VWTLDPHTDFNTGMLELFRCCLGRTLLSYNGRPTEDGGATLRPDVAATMPEVSGDGLTWTFRLKRGLRYAPPLEHTDIVATDFIRALERAATVGKVFNYEGIEGFIEFMRGRAGSISGMEALDDHTLVVHLTEPNGQLGHLLSLPAAAPIPPNSEAAGALGTAEGHDRGYGRFLVSSGPYMFEGSEDLDFAVAPKDREPVSGFAGKSVVLVRNPSWDPATDDLRPAYADQIEVTLTHNPKAGLRAVSRADVDVFMNDGLAPLLPPETVEEYQNDEVLRERLYVGARDIVNAISINVAEPPFDDLHVRRAINLVVDKSALLDLVGGATTGEVAGHIFFNSMENSLLADYDPYATPGSRGDLDAAKDEMALSRYDRDGDGICDAPSCEGITTIVDARLAASREIAASVKGDLASIGIGIEPEALFPDQAFPRLADPSAHVALAVYFRWAKDYPNAGGFVDGVFNGEAAGAPCCNWSLVGASPGQLRKAGYETRSVPSIDDKIAECRALVGDAQVSCWAETDRLLMETVVPWVPLVFEHRLFLVSERVVNASIDQFATLPAFDRIAISDSRNMP